jgi:hypothetical protein
MLPLPQGGDKVRMPGFPPSIDRCDGGNAGERPYSIRRGSWLLPDMPASVGHRPAARP